MGRIMPSNDSLVSGKAGSGRLFGSLLAARILTSSR
jgi:hypothetical protein